MNEHEVVEWMVNRYKEHNFLYQDDVSSHLLHVNPDFVYYDKNSNLCINKNILSLFKKATPDIVYERAGKFWRNRLETDQNGRAQ